jgi:hypothetical protein
MYQNFNKEEESDEELPNNKSFNNKDDILFIENVNLKNINEYNDDNLQCDLEECLIDKENSKYEKEYDKIREKFTTLDNWHSTNLACHYCNNFFINKPVFIPKQITSNQEIICSNNFCSFSCAAKYIHIYYKDNDILKSNYINNLKYLYKIFYGKDITLIRESPDYTLQTRYGGTLTTEEYKDKIKKIKHIF